MKKALVMAIWAGVSLSATAELDRVYFSNPGFTTLNLNGNSYQALAQEGLQAGPTLIVMGSLADGSGTKQVISGDWGSTWVENPINSATYSVMTTRIGTDNQFYGLKADGSGIDLIYYSGGWQVFSPPVSTDTTYKAITADATDTRRLFAARSDGTGVDRLHFNDLSQWVVDQSLLSTTDFSELETMTGVNNSFYGVRADGSGLGRVVYSGGWQTLDVTNIAYKALAADAYYTGNGVLMVYGARADGTGVDRLRSDDWGYTWYVDFPQLTTKDYDVLSTMHGVANQFYGSAIPEPATLAQFTSVTALGDGSVQLAGTGPTNASYRILATTNVSLPLDDWEEVGSGTFTDGVLSFTDSQATAHPQRYYRAVTP